MTMFISESRSDPLEVLVAGGGVAALEALIALHALAGARVRVTLLCPQRDFRYRPLAVAEPFELASMRTWRLDAIAREHSAVHRLDALAAVDPERRTVTTSGGETLPYEALLVAIGARAEDAVPGALTFRGPPDVEAFRSLLDSVEGGGVERLAFVVPTKVTWTLPLYELALMTAARLSARGLRGVRLTLVTPEPAPLSMFGRRAADTVARLLRDAGVELRAGTPVVELANGQLRLVDGRAIGADRAVALPRLTAAPIPGLPRTRSGFVPTDPHGLVDGLGDVYAAGDISWYPVKQGGVAAQQADAAARAIAAQAGAPISRQAFRPVLRGILLTGGEPEYLRSSVHRHGRPASSETPLWAPHAKIAGRYLAPYLAGNPPGGELTDVGPDAGDGATAALALALEAADADAGWDDYEAALRWLDVAEQLAVALPIEYADKRQRWRAALTA